MHEKPGRSSPAGLFTPLIRNFATSAAFIAKTGELIMRIKMTLLAIAYVAVSALLLAIAYQPQGSVATAKTDRLEGASFLVERFAG